MKNNYLRTESGLLKKKYYKFIESLPDSIGLQNSYVDRLYGRDKFFGEYFGYWLSELYEIKDQEFIRELSFGSILLRSYIFMQDDIFDGDLEKSPNNILLADYFLTKSIEVFYSLVANSNLFWKKFNSFFEDYIGANIKFSQHIMYYSKYTIDDFEKYVEKISLIKLPLFVIKENSSLKSSNINIYPLIKHLSIAFQFSDDLCDWKKDYLSGYFTYPITLLMGILKNYKLEEKKGSEYLALMRTIIGSSNFSNIFFELIEFHLRKSIEYISNTPQICLYKFLIGILNSIHNEQERISVILKRNNSYFTSYSLFNIESFCDHKIIKLNPKKMNKYTSDLIKMDFTYEIDDLFSSLSPPLLQKSGVGYALRGSINGHY